MSKSNTAELLTRLRHHIGTLRRNSMPLADLIPLLTETTDALDRERNSRQEAQRQLEDCQARLASSRLDLMRELQADGWTAPARPGAVPRPISDFPELQALVKEKIDSGELSAGGLEAEQHAPRLGVSDSSCNYLAPWPGGCNKCGREHDGKGVTWPLPTAVNTGAPA